MVYVLAEVDLICGFEMETKVYTTFNKAITAFEARVAEIFIFDAIHDLRVDKEPTTGLNILKNYELDSVQFDLFDKNGDECDVPTSLKEFCDRGKEITLEVGDVILTLRGLKEEAEED